MNENDLRNALHDVLDDAPVRAVPYERISAGGRKRRRVAMSGAAAAAVAVLAGTMLVGGPAPAPSPIGAEPSGRASAPAPATAGGYCPVNVPSGTGSITRYPDALEALLGAEDAGQDPRFTPERAIVCRYELNKRPLIGAAELGADEAKALWTTLTTTRPMTQTYYECAGQKDDIQVFFGGGPGRGDAYLLTASDCFLWRTGADTMGPTTIHERWRTGADTMWPKTLSEQVRALVPVGAGL